jgi:hypothetical protein
MSNTQPEGQPSTGTATAPAPESSNLPVKDSGLFPFDVAPVVTLKDNTVHKFRLPTREDEQRREDRMKSIIITSPARINGQNPKQSTTDYSKSEISYYEDLIEEITGIALDEGGDPTKPLQANMVVDEVLDTKGKPVPITIGEMVPTKHKRAAAARIYGGKIEVVKPDADAEENAVEGEAPKQLLVIRSQRFITVRHDLGSEQQDDGTMSDPTHTVFYVFREPQAKQLSHWETKCFNGFTINLKGGGTREERTFNLTAVESLFDSLIERVEGASIGGQPIDVRIPEHKAAIPLSLKKTTVALMMGEVMGDVGN